MQESNLVATTTDPCSWWEGCDKKATWIVGNIDIGSDATAKLCDEHKKAIGPLPDKGQGQVGANWERQL